MKLALQQPKSLAEIAALLDIPIASDDAQIQITHLATLENATSGSITFLANPKYKGQLPETKASAVILTDNGADKCPAVALITKNPRLALAKLLLLCEKNSSQTSGVHPTAVLGKNVKLGSNVTVGANCFIGDNCIIGDNCDIKPNATIYHGVTLGNNCIIHSNTVIGSDGFGYAVDDDGSWVKMLHLGGVVIGNNVEIGSNTSIDRGMLDNTEIGNNVIIDNLVQIGHNVTIGDRTAIAGCAGIAGSTSIGKNCLIGGAACIAGHLIIGDFVNITGTSSVNHSLLEPGVYSSGFPAKENSVWRRNVARFMFLDNMAKRIKDLEKSINK